MGYNHVCGIYKISNKACNKFYIGSSVNIHERWKRHLRDLRHNKHQNILLQRAYNKYGESNFTFEIIEVVGDRKNLLQREQHYLEKLNAVIDGYNICGVAGNRYGVKHTKESKDKMSRARKGVPLSEECKKHMSESRKGHKVSQETRLKLHLANKGKKPSTNTLQACYVSVRCIETQHIFESITSANKWLGVKKSHISACCRGIRETSCGYHWEYVKN